MFTGLFSSDKAKDVVSSNTTGSPHRPRKLSSSAASRPPATMIPTRPPFPHPLPHRHLTVVHTAQGIVLYPGHPHHAPTSSYSGRAALIKWGRAATVGVLDDYSASADRGRARCASYGVVGILKLFQESYLLVISSKRHVGRYLDSQQKSIHCLTGILSIPLSDPTQAKATIEEQSRNRTKEDHPTSPSSRKSRLTEISESSSSDTSDSESTDSPGSFEAAEEPMASALHLPGPNVDQSEGLGGDGKLSLQLDAAVSPAKPGPTATGTFGLGRFFWSSPSHSSGENATASELISITGSATPPVTASPSPSQVENSQSRPPPSTGDPEKLTAASPGHPDAESLQALDQKVLKEAITEMTSGGFFYSQEFDITRNTQRRWLDLKEEKAHLAAEHQTGLSAKTQGQRSRKWLPGRTKPHLAEEQSLTSADFSVDIRKDEPKSSIPLTQKADKRFWWNNWLSKPFLDAGLEEYITVVMQGYAQSSRVPVSFQAMAAEPINEDAEEQMMSIMIISRRSVERPGLRYQRRGINDSGGVANFVESEFIMSTTLNDQHHVSSYVQIRGSIPLYWSQSPWSLKPIPVLERSEKENLDAISKHFSKQTRLYGKVYIVNLAEQAGKEGIVVKAYKNRVEEMGEEDVKYKDWDFHHICKGMHFEKIAILVDELASDIEDVGAFWNMDSENMSLQRGVFRTNCMDCLDRTNVVQSALARNAMRTFLVHLGFDALGPSCQEKLELAFNEVWANNGDAISREYAGTSALKGDFVRSGKRNWRGQLNDATNSIARYWQNTVLDFFKQSMIDYVLGINLNAFVEFSEQLRTSDPGEIVRLAAIRKAAIDTACSSVLLDGESKIHGWTPLSPSTLGAIRDAQYEEKILLVTARAAYCCSYEYTLQKVRDYVRIPLGQIVGIQKGEYILSALDSSARNVEENYGFILKYLPEGASGRSRTYSIRNRSDTNPAVKPAKIEESDSLDASTCMIAFKALRRDFVRDLDTIQSEIRQSGRTQVDAIVQHLRQACEDAGATDEADESFVTEEAIISLADAKSQVGLLDRLGHELKNMIWL